MPPGPGTDLGPEDTSSPGVPWPPSPLAHSGPSPDSLFHPGNSSVPHAPPRSLPRPAGTLWWGGGRVPTPRSGRWREVQWGVGAGGGQGRSPYSVCHSAGVNIGGAGSYIYEKPSAEGPQVTGPIEVPVVRAEERKASGPPRGPSKGGLGSVSGRRGVPAARPCPALTPPSLSLQRHHVHGGAQRVSSLQQEGLLR